jgi:hypothetical protein
VAADVVQPQAFVADIKNATSGMNMSVSLSQSTTTGNGNFSTNLSYSFLISAEHKGRGSKTTLIELIFP